MIKDRYEKYYEISLNDYVTEILQAVNQDSQVKSNSNYRNYTQVIMRILDQYRNKPPKAKKTKKFARNISKNSKDNIKDGDISLNEKWKAATSISKKTILCDALEYILEHSKEVIISKSKKRGMYQTQKEEEKIEYYVVATDNPSSSDFIKRYNDILRIKEENGISRITILYPCKTGINDEFSYDDVIFYDVDRIPLILEQVYSNTEIIEDVLTYLVALESRC